MPDDVEPENVEDRGDEDREKPEEDATPRVPIAAQLLFGPFPQ